MGVQCRVASSNIVKFYTTVVILGILDNVVQFLDVEFWSLRYAFVKIILSNVIGFYLLKTWLQFYDIILFYVF